LLIEGYFIKEDINILYYLIDLFKAGNKKVALTLSANFIVENYYSEIIDLANKSDLIFCNFEEALILAKDVNAKTIDEVALLIHRLFKPGERILVITDGKHPVFVSRYDYINNQMDYELKSSVFPCKKENIVDTNGCGDGI
jgi:sugar/nucleoside kinase (ribokinase family)